MIRIPASFARAALAGVLLASLAGCVEMAIGTAVVSTLAATDRRSIGAQADDKTIMLKGESKIANQFGDAHVNVTPYNRRVLLTGEVKDDATKAAIEREIAGIDGVAGVVNELEVAPVSSLGSRSSDTLVTTKVRAALVDQKELASNAFKIVTERGNVYLLGRVTQREGAIAAEATSNVSGVRKVVKIFEYISEEEKLRLTKAQ